MKEKGLNLPSPNAWTLKSGPMHQWRFGVLIALVFVGMVTVWSIDGCTIKGFLEAWSFNHRYVTLKVDSQGNLSFTYSFHNLNHTFRNLSHDFRGNTSPSARFMNPSQQNSSQSGDDIVVHGLSVHGDLTENQTDVSNSSGVLPEIRIHTDVSNSSGVLPEMQVHSVDQSQQNLSHSGDDVVVHGLSVHGDLTEKQIDVSNSSGVLPEIRVHTDVSNSSGVLPEMQVHSVKKPGGVSLTKTIMGKKPSLDWISVEFRPNFTSNLLARWLAPGGEPCKESRTVEIRIPGLDGKNSVELSAGDVHEFGFQALDENGKLVCIGGDYFETDLSGESWKSRPVVKDFGNGSYSMLLQVHPDFAGDYNLTVNLLFRHFQGLKYSPQRFSYDKELRRIPVRFYKSTANLPELKTCQRSDFGKDIWAGRWTRHGKNDDCEISNDGRYRCLPPNFPCKSPWCSGSLGMLESNGWVYSAHCSFKLFSADAAWNCLKNQWIFFWGDSNHVDTIRNMLNFMLDLPQIPAVPRRFDMKFSNPRDSSQSVRITNIFNGHWNETGNYLGLDSLQNEGFRNLLKKYFSGDKVPDTIIMNSGLHDGVHYHNLRAFAAGANYATKFWVEVLGSVRQRGLEVPKVIYRNTIATGGYARTLAFNPSKMEAFNGVLIDKLKQANILSGVIDDFDLTFPWHFDNRCNDGVHYGRAPLKRHWRDGQIGHQYFVDLMLGHVLLNALCAM